MDKTSYVQQGDDNIADPHKTPINENYPTREDWLQAAVDVMRDCYFGRDSIPDLPEKVRGLCSFALRSTKAIGQCHSPKASADGTHYVLVCPSQAEPVRVLDILLHELIHAAVGVEHKHKSPFVKVVRAVGLAGKPTATFAEEGSPLHDRLTRLAEQLGPYPHSQLSKLGKVGEKTARRAWPTLISVEDETYKLRLSWEVLERGFPIDPWGKTMILHPNFKGLGFDMETESDEFGEGEGDE